MTAYLHQRVRCHQSLPAVRFTSGYSICPVRCQPRFMLHHVTVLKPSLSPWQSIMLALREGDDETAQLAALNELCELLAVSSEDALSMFPIDTLVPVLVRPCSVGLQLALPALGIQQIERGAQ